MKKLVFFFCSFVLLSTMMDAQILKRKINQYKNGKPQGLWIMYSDSVNSKIESRGRYVNGKEKGKWKYYYENGKLRKKEKFKVSGIRTKFYYETGKIKSKGIAKLEPEDSLMHYYFQGIWKYYNENGKLTSIVLYEKGQEVSTVHY
ncbi:MAG TPA: hypothetical protein PKK99_15840 [Bacteroidia bacterium]|nr:hypothetical protein [Bacteroidia bacterium]